MISIDATATSGRGGVNCALLEWWLKKTLPEIAVAKLFDEVPDEWITSIHPKDVGMAILKARDFFKEFVRDVAADPCAEFMMVEYGDPDRLKDWLADFLGSKVRNLPAWGERLKNIRAAQRKLKTVRRVLES